jgi:hypothetical protein
VVSPSGQPPAQALLYTATALPVASILGMDNINGRRPPRPINVVPTFHSTMSQDTSRYFSTSTEETTNRSDSRAFFIEETILCAFRERLASKDERVAELEKKLVETSFSSGARRRFPSGCSHADTAASSPLQADSTLRVILNRRHSLPAGKQVQYQLVISGPTRSEP